MLKIYFAASISGGRQNQPIFKAIIELLRNYGQVLTEHVGSPSLTTKGEGLSDREIYERDVDLMKQADVFVAEISTPSNGVGYELGVAESLHKPVLCLYQPSDVRNAMIKGNPKFQVKSYFQIKDVENIFTNYFSRH